MSNNPWGVFYLLTVKITAPSKASTEVYLRTETWLEELAKIKDCFNPLASIEVRLTHDHSGDTWVHKPPSHWDRNPEAGKCACGQREVPAGADGVHWYWQLHRRDACTLELPNEKCWCGRLRSEHVDGHDESKRETKLTELAASSQAVSTEPG